MPHLLERTHVDLPNVGRTQLVEGVLTAGKRLFGNAALGTELLLDGRELKTHRLHALALRRGLGLQMRPLAQNAGILPDLRNVLAPVSTLARGLPKPASLARAVRADRNRGLRLRARGQNVRAPLHQTDPNNQHILNTS
eukprot:4419150-Lingulodinium_polyedra.AAC.1